jgi:hypothetical protein
MQERNGNFRFFKDTAESIFNVGDSILINHDKYAVSQAKLLNHVKRQTMNFGDPQLLNEFVYHNFPTSVSYFDDDLEKTAFYLDLVSKNDNNCHYVRRSQNYELYSSQYLPLYAFRKYCSGARAINQRHEYPKELRSMLHEEKKYE